MCRVLKMAHLQRLKIIYVFKQGVLTDMAGKVLVVDDEKTPQQKLSTVLKQPMV